MGCAPLLRQIPETMAPHGQADRDIALILPSLARASVLVVGDAMLDRYVFGEVSRISPEAPVPVLAVGREVALPGGAGNVVRNLTALGTAAALISVVGDDQAGSELTGLIGGQPNVEPWLLVQGSRCTTIKTRFVADGQQLLRADHEVTAPIHPKLADRLIRIATDALAATSIMVLSDYAKGVLVGATPARLVAVARNAGRKVVVDPRGADLGRFSGADVVVVTERSLDAATGGNGISAETIGDAARSLRNAHQFGAVVVNRRSRGYFLSAAEDDYFVPACNIDAFDFTGSGDTVVAAISACLATGSDLHSAVRLAAMAASISASQPGMAVAAASDILALTTPEGRARRKVMTLQNAADQVAFWRRLNLRVGLLTMEAQSLPPLDAIGVLKGRTDRLVLGIVGSWGRGEEVAELASHAGADVICVDDRSTVADFVAQLQPDLVA